MTIPTFDFSMRDAAKRDTARRWADLLVSTRRFARNEKGSLCFLANLPDDWCPLHRKPDFIAVIEDGGLVKVTGASMTDASVTDLLWFWASEYRWKLPRIGGAWSPPKPLPVTRTGPDFVRHVDQVRK